MLEILLNVYIMGIAVMLVQPESLKYIAATLLWPVLAILIAYTLIRELIHDRKHRWHMR